MEKALARYLIDQTGGLVAEAHLANILKVDPSAEVSTYDIDQRALSRARMVDGKPIRVSNMPDHTLAEIAARYKALADIERRFRVLKSEIEIAPLFPSPTEPDSRACADLFPGAAALSGAAPALEGPGVPERALEIARRIQFHQITLHQRWRRACRP